MAGVVLVFREILAHPDRHRYDLSSLQCAILGGTTVPPQLMRQVETELGIRRTCQAYGMTESGCFLSSSFYIACDDDRRYTSIGRCMPHVELKIVDNEGRTVPIGCEGEIWARGYSIMRGYYGDREQTAKMITDAAWLRTGDLGTMDQDGYLYFVGRKKEMFLHNGMKIYPGEIEQIIGEHASVAEVYVFSIPDPSIDETVCAWVKLKPNMKCEVDELKTFLTDKLPAYKIPEHIRFVD
ncbi:unnamed protein product, partial [Rotaria sp. Silwood1]